MLGKVGYVANEYGSQTVGAEAFLDLGCKIRTAFQIVKINNNYLLHIGKPWWQNMIVLIRILLFL